MYGLVKISKREKWKQIKKVERKGIWYDVPPNRKHLKIFVSNFGRIKRVKIDGTEKITKGHKNISKKGKVYMYTSITYIDDGINVSKDFKVHRLVAYAFLNKPDWADIINHLDNDGSNNLVENLEWTNCIGNNHHAMSICAIPHVRGENHQSAKLDNKALKIICDMLINKYTNSEIYSRITDMGYVCHKKSINKIRNKKTWKHITSEMIFPSAKSVNKIEYDDKLIHDICKLIVENKTNKEIINIMNLNEIMTKPRSYIPKIRNKKSKNYISDLYFDKPYKLK